MPDETATPTNTIPDDGQPVVGETSTQEFSPAELGIDIPGFDPAKDTPATPDTPDEPQTPEDPDDIVGPTLGKRGRPARDLSDLDDDEKKLFENMSRQAYEKLYPFYKQFRGKDKDLAEVESLRAKIAEFEKSKTQPSSFYDHEEAYYLSPDFRQALSERADYDQMLSHWQAQLEALEEGKPITDLGRDQNGQLAYGQQIEPSPRVKAQVLSMIAQLTQARATADAKLGQVREAHTQNYNNYKSDLQKAFDTLFGKYKDQLSPLAKNELKYFPDFTHGRPETQLMTHALALIRHMAAQAKTDQQAIAANQANRNGQRIAGPTMRSMTTSPKPSGDRVSDDEYKAFKAEFM